MGKSHRGGPGRPAALKRASIRKINRTHREPGRDAIEFESQEEAALWSLDEWPRLARPLDLAKIRKVSLAFREQSRKEYTAWWVEQFRHVDEVRGRKLAIGRSSQTNATSNPSS